MSEGTQITLGIISYPDPWVSGHGLDQGGNLSEREPVEKWASSKSLGFTDERCCPLLLPQLKQVCC